MFPVAFMENALMRLKNPVNSKDVIRQDYRDKHASEGSVLLCRKYDHELKVKGEDSSYEVKKDKNGNPIIIKGDWFEAKELTVNEDQYVRSNHFFSEKKQNDCYSTMNHFPTDYPPEVFKEMNGGGTYRTAANLAYLVGYYIDFDFIPIHKIAKEQQASTELVEEVLGYAEVVIRKLEGYLPSDFGMPIVTYTGGGLGFYFPIKPLKATKENVERYMEVYEKLHRRFSTLFAELEVFENDHKVVGSERVIRVTGTYNSKVGTCSRYIARYGKDYAQYGEVYKYSIGDIVELYHLDEITVAKNEESNTSLVSLSPSLNKREKRREEAKLKECGKALPKKGDKAPGPSVDLPSQYKSDGNTLYPTKWYHSYVNPKQMNRYLELSVKSVEYLDNKGTLNRNNALFLITCLLKELELAKYGYKTLGDNPHVWSLNITSYVTEVNDSLTDPLDDEELDRIIKSAFRHQYNFRKREAFQEFLSLTDEEMEELGWLDKQRKEEAKKERSKADVELDKEVIRLWLSGLSDAKIAKELGIPKLKSKRIRERLGVKGRDIKIEDIDFEAHRRHIKKQATVEAPVREEAPVYPYMPWYKPTRKTEGANAVVERAKKLEKLRDSYFPVREARRKSDLAVRMANPDDELVKQIRAEMEEATKRERARYIEENKDDFKKCYDKFGEASCKKMWGESYYDELCKAIGL